MGKEEQTFQGKDIIIILLIIGILFLGGYFILFPNEICSDDDLAILNVEVYTLAQNLYDDSEMFYEYFIYNYGNVEAKNVKVTCNSWDENMNLQFSLTDSFGNIASKSYEFGEVIGKNKLDLGEEYMSACYVESCDNCKILYKEIPELIEYFERE